MVKAIDGLQAKSIYQVAGNAVLGWLEQQSLLYLYQPIIGSDALALYLTLQSEAVEGELLHGNLCSAMNTGLTQIYQARLRLEGIGLLETYIKDDSELGAKYLYQLIDPLLPSAFFKESIFAFLLLDRVGEHRYHHLAARYQPLAADLGSYQAISAKFSEVYRWQATEFAGQAAQLQQTAENFEKTPPKERIAEDSFDWQLFEGELRRLKVTFAKKDRELLRVFHLLFGADELTLAEYAAHAADPATQVVDPAQLRRLLDQRQPQKQMAPAVSAATDTASLKADGFSDKDIEVIEQSKTIAPVLYLKALKQAKGGYETDQEVRIVEQLIKRSGLSTAVINILLDYVLVINDQASLNSSYTNSIANDWAQKQIVTPEDAIRHVRGISKDVLKKKTKTKRPNTYSPRQTRREKLPDWVNKPQKTKKLSSDQEAELDRRLQEFMKQKEGDR